MPIVLSQILMHIVENFVRCQGTSILISYSVDVFVIEDGHKKDSITEVFRFNVGYLQIALDSVKNFQCCESWENCPLKLLRVRFRVQVSGHVWDDQRLYSATRLFGRHPSRCSAPLVFALRVACVCACGLSHPRPPDRSQHGCTVGVLPGPTRVLPMPRQYGIGRRAPTRAVLSCAASWCVVVRHVHGLWNMPPVRFVLCPLAPLLDMVTAVSLSILRDTSHHSWLISFADMTDL